jgi:hypothetical protein
MENINTPFIPVIKATIADAEQTDFGKAIREGINTFSEGIPVLVLMKALDELKSVHPFIGGELSYYIRNEESPGE